MKRSEEIQMQIIKNVSREIDDKSIDALCDKDVVYASLYSDMKKAEMNQQYFKARIIERQLAHRRNEVMTKEVQRRILTYVNNGQINRYLPECQIEKIDRAATMMFLLLNAADSAAVDMKGAYEECGFGPQELFVQQKINKVREILQEVYSEKEVSATVIADTVNDEADKIYSNLRDRYDIIRRKCERILTRKAKEDERKNDEQCKRGT